MRAFAQNAQVTKRRPFAARFTGDFIMAKGGSKTLTGILCFIFGFLFAIIVEAAVIGLGVYFVLNANIDDIFSTVGIDNTDDDGNKIYINTDVESGGVEKVTDLISALRDIAGKGADNLTIGDFEVLFPIADTGIDKIYSSLADALSGYDLTEDDLREILDEDELKSTPISRLGTFFTNSLNNVEVETVLRIAGMDVESNDLYLSVAYGAEAQVIYSADGSVAVLYKDTFTLSDSSAGGGAETYVRTGDNAVLPEEYAGYLVPRANGTEYVLYYALSDTARAQSAYVAQQADDGSFSATQLEYSLYSADVAEISGGYYYNLSGELVVLHALTIGEVRGDENGLMSVFDDVYLTDLLGGQESVDDVFLSTLEGITFGDLLNNKVVFNDLLDRITVPQVIDVTPDDAIMLYMGYSLTDVAAAQGDDYNYTGTLHFYEMGDDGSWIETSTPTAYITVGEANTVESVYYYDESGNKVDYSGVSITNINSQTANIQYSIKVKDIIDIDENSDKFMQKIGEYYLADVGDVVDELVLSDFLGNIDPEDSLMVYMVYGVNGVEAVTDETLGYSYTATYNLADGTTAEAYIVTEYVYDETTGARSEVITEVYYYAAGDDGTSVKTECGTHINDVNARVDGLMNDLTLDEIMEISSDNTILDALRDSTINSLAGDVNSLSIQQLFADDIYVTQEGETKVSAVLYKVVEDENAVTDSTTQIAFDSAYLYYAKTTEGDIVLAGSDGHFDTFAEMAGVTYYTYGAPVGVWSLLLYNNDGYEEVYTVNNVAEMQLNVMKNIQNCTLFRFYEMGVIGDGTATEADPTYKTLLTDTGNGEQIGDLTIEGFLEHFGSLPQGGTGN